MARRPIVQAIAPRRGAQRARWNGVGRVCQGCPRTIPKGAIREEATGGVSVGRAQNARRILEVDIGDLLVAEA